jgi:hypothetical protein
MKNMMFRQGLIICLICILIFPSIAVATVESNSDYNLKVKIKSTKFFHRELSPCQLLVNVSNEGLNISNDYSVSIEVYTLFTWGKTDWFILFNNYSYTGSPLAPNRYNTTQYTFTIWVTGWYLVRATINSNDDNPKGNVSYCFLWVQFHSPTSN